MAVRSGPLGDGEPSSMVIGSETKAVMGAEAVTGTHAIMEEEDDGIYRR